MKERVYIITGAGESWLGRAYREALEREINRQNEDTPTFGRVAIASVSAAAASSTARQAHAYARHVEKELFEIYWRGRFSGTVAERKRRKAEYEAAADERRRHRDEIERGT